MDTKEIYRQVDKVWDKHYEDELAYKNKVAQESLNPKNKGLTYRDNRAYGNMMKQKALYSPCMCGSGKKFKFCCYDKARNTMRNYEISP